MKADILRADQTTMAVVDLQEVGQTSQNKFVKWKEVIADHNCCELADDGTTVIFKTGVVFCFMIDVVHTSSSSGFQIELQLNGEFLRRVPGYEGTGHGNQSTMSVMRQIKAGDKIKLLYLGSNKTYKKRQQHGDRPTAKAVAPNVAPSH